MRLVERVVLRLLDVVPELPRDLLRGLVRDAAADELVLQRGHQLVNLLPDRLAQVVRFGGVKPPICLAISIDCSW